jgi:predicted helicase
MFAQTLAYGLFAARIHTPVNKTFSREMAAFSLPKTNPFLRKLFAEFAGVDMPETFGWAVDDLVELLKHAAMDEVLKDFGKGKGKEDPVVHFYETFLAAYDPKMREVRGVYYTPEPVVSYIVRSIDYLLKTCFNRPKGLADENTLILDPATGTATFLYFVVRQVYEQIASQKGAWDSYVSEHLLNRLFGFELLMAPYAIAHLKLGLELQETGYSFASDQRLGIYLTNTLEEAAKKSEKLIAKWISDEANEASEIKRDRPILVILGNPPYSGHSANRSEVVRQLRPGDSYKVIRGGPLRANKVMKVLTAKTAKRVREKTFIGDLLDDYRLVDGSPLREKNPKWLQDDYVKFIRFAQWRIERTGYGILGFITNHSYLDSPTFRGMRQSLMQSFNEIYVFNLHGNSKKKERAPGGGNDKNVFDIQQGVAIILAVKEEGKTAVAQVHQCDLWGPRSEKYTILSERQVRDTAWISLAPSSPMYLFVPQENGPREEYNALEEVTHAMPTSTLGFQTHRDPVAVAFSEEELRAKIARFLGSAPSDDEWGDYARPCCYRPFDFRWVYLHRRVCDRPRLEVMRDLFHPNVALNLMRQTKAEYWRHAFVSRHPTPAVFLEIKDGSSVFPLMAYHDPADKLKAREGQLWVGFLPWQQGEEGRRPNLGVGFIQLIELTLQLDFITDVKGDLQSTFGPEDVLSYFYAIFYSDSYRSRYASVLKSGFPRVPLTSDRGLFGALCGKGAELVALHVMESAKLDQLITTFPEKGSNVVEKVTYVDATQRVCINGIQYFQGVARDAWEFYIGGYQVLERWLKDRKGRELTWDDTQHYQKIVVALKGTIRLMDEIDAVIDAHGGWPLR